MGTLRHKYHLDWTTHPVFKQVMQNTATADLAGWVMIVERISDSLNAYLWSLWKVWNHQLSDPTRINKLYIGWLSLKTHPSWPLGAVNIPTAELNRAKLGKAILLLNEANALL